MMQAAKNNDLNQFETLNQLAKDYLSTLIENRKKKKINVRLMHKKNIVFICLWEFFAALPMRQTKWSKRTLSLNRTFQPRITVTCAQTYLNILDPMLICF